MDTPWDGDTEPPDAPAAAGQGWDRAAVSAGLQCSNKGPLVCPISAIIKYPLVPWGEQTQPTQGLAEGLRGPRPPGPPTPAPG